MNQMVREGMTPALRDGGARERRVVTILFCDVAGSTSIAEQLDPEEWAEIMHMAFDALMRPIERYGGTIARLMGDAVLAFFGAPRAHEDDPRRAILAALDIVAEVAPLRDLVRQTYGLEFNVRIGINTGDVVVGEFGSAAMNEYTAMGDAINLAARLQQEAEPGSILVGETTYRATAPFFRFESVGQLALRGKARAENAYRVLQPTDVSGRLWDIAGLDAPLIGRTAELDLLCRAYEGLSTGKGHVACLIGDAGMGKSRLIAHLRGVWEADRGRGGDVAWLEHRVVSFAGLEPYGALRQRLRRVFGIARHDTAESVHAKVMRATQHFPPATRERATRIITAVLGVGDEASPAQAISEGISADAFRRELALVMKELLRGWNRGKPVVFVSDDHHLIDLASEELVVDLLQLVEDAPVLFVLAFRPELGSPVWKIIETCRERYHSGFSEIWLAPLAADERMALFDSLVRSDDGQRLRELVLEKAGGNPLFIEEIVRSLIDQGYLEPCTDCPEQQWRVAPHADLSQVTIPSTLHALILERVDRLAPEVRQHLQLASVIGRSFSRDLLEAISPAPDSIADHLAVLTKLDLVTPDAEFGAGAYSFRHPLIQEVVYSTLIRRFRSEVHRRIGGAIERLYDGRLDERAGEIGWHYSQAGDERAVGWLLKAAERAGSVGEPHAAINYTTTAIELSQRLELQPRPRAYQLRAEAAELVGDFPAASRDFTDAITAARAIGDGEAEWRALLGLGIAWTSRDYRVAGDYLHQALERAQLLRHPLAVAHSLNRIGNWHSNIGQPEAAVRAHEEALAVFEAARAQSGRAESLDLLALARFMAGDLRGSDALYEHAIAEFRSIDERRGLASSLAMRTAAGGSPLAITVPPADGDPDQRTRYALESLDLSREMGWQAGEVYALVTLAGRSMLQGHYQSALAYATAGYDRAVEIGHRQWSIAALCLLGATMMDLLQFEEAYEHFCVAQEKANRTGSEFWRRTSTAGVTDTLLGQGRIDEARRELNDALRDNDRLDALARRECWLRRARIALAEGDPARCVAIVDMLHRAIQPEVSLDAVPHLALLRAQALAAQGLQAEALAALDQTAAGARCCGWRPVLWRALAVRSAIAPDRPELGAPDRWAAAASEIVADLASEIADPGLRSSFTASAAAVIARGG